MLKIPDAVKEITEKNQLIKFGLAHRLLNLTQLANFIKPQVEARTKKSTKTSAITMALSRIQNTLEKLAPKIEDFELENLAIQKNLAILTYFKNSKVQKALSTIHEEAITITEGTNEITITIPETLLSKTTKLLEKAGQEPKSVNENLTSIAIKFDEKYNYKPGLLHLILQQLTLQHINIVEITSTHTELIIYLHEEDTRLAFDTLVTSF
jgi:hypothetical protein